MISVIILTKNEAVDIAGAIKSCAFSDDIHVFDSLSTDGTQQIARDLGATVHERAFDNYSAQRNASLTTPQFRNDW
ncbi:MAG: glycosyltransferase, partial [Terriglobus sp.]